MNKPKLLIILLTLISLSSFASEPTVLPTAKIYGFIGNDFYYNSRQNIEAIDGIVHLFPKPIDKTKGYDSNERGQAEMLSIMTRIGVNLTGNPVFGAKTSAKIEADFAGFGTNNYVLRIRHAYARLDWAKTQLTVGQNWHPFFTSLFPGTLSMNAGAPFQPFNRSPMICLQQKLTNTLALTGAAIYQLQFASQGPQGTSNIYLKKAQTPEIYLGIENKNTHWTLGASFDFKRIVPDSVVLASKSASVYAQYNSGLLSIRARSVLGQNLSEQLMIGGYGVSRYATNGTATEYTNYNTLTNWISCIYGKKVQAELYLGSSCNLGTIKALANNTAGKFSSYGYGFYDVNGKQLILNKLFRIAPQLMYNVSNLQFGLEYDCTIGQYGQLQSSGIGKDSESVTNHRLIGRMIYHF